MLGVLEIRPAYFFAPSSVFTMSPHGVSVTSCNGCFCNKSLAKNHAVNRKCIVQRALAFYIVPAGGTSDISRRATIILMSTSRQESPVWKLRSV